MTEPHQPDQPIGGQTSPPPYGVPTNSDDVARDETLRLPGSWTAPRQSAGPYGQPPAAPAPGEPHGMGWALSHADSSGQAPYATPPTEPGGRHAAPLDSSGQPATATVPSWPAVPNQPSQPGQPYPGQPYPGQPYPGQPQPGQPYPGQAVPGQGYPVQVFPSSPGGPYQMGFDPAPPPRKKRTGLFVGIALGVALLLCAGGGTAAYLVIQNSQPVGQASPNAATLGFLQAVFKERDATSLAKYVCPDARKTESLKNVVQQLVDSEEKLDVPAVNWTTPSIDSRGDTATAHVELTLSTMDERVAKKKLDLELVDDRGWWVCDATAVG